MDDNFEEYSEEEIKNLIDKFESMLESNQTYFFDVNDFEVIIDYYLERNNLSKTSIALRYATGQHPKSVGLLLKKAQLYAFSDKTDKALELLAKVELLDPTNSDVFFTKGAIYSQLKRYEKAIEEYHKAINKAEELDEVYINIAFEYENLGNYNKAIDYLKKALEINPDNEAVLYELSINYEFADKMNDSIAFFENYLEENPYSKVGWLNLGIAFNIVGLYEKAVDAFDFSIAIDDNFLIGHYNKAATYINLNQFQRAIDIYLEILELEDNKAIGNYYIGECYEKLENFILAVKFYDIAIEYDDHFADAWLGRGMACYELKNVEESIKDISRAIEIDPENSEYLFLLADIQQKEGMLEALETYRLVSELEPTNIDIWIEYSDAYQEADDLDKAIEIIKTGISFQPENAELFYRLSAYLLLNKDTKEAYNILDVALDMDLSYADELIEYISEFEENNHLINVINQFKIDIKTNKDKRTC